MKWEKLGRIFNPAGRAWWMRTHAANPVAMPIGGDRLRIYCCGRDAQQRSQVGYFEMDLKRPGEVLDFSEEPFLGIGPLGAYDDCGVLNACYLDDGSRQLHYYSGITLGTTVPFRFFASVAVSDDGGRTARKLSPAPLLGMNEVDPYLTGSPCVLRDGERFRMWYTSGVRWELFDGIPRHFYHIKYAESANGVDWLRKGTVCVDFADKDEYVVARPCVRIMDDGRFAMWYSYRGDRYRIGYAESSDGLRWERLDQRAGIEASPSGWDSEMVCYAFVFDHGPERYMLYNGNGYGESGIGLARLVQ
ncbi:MAG TPA: hypothetical protein VMV65_03210 [Alphaproteobacteria bacterium]|nr:hypothetical protein [Alphaproteobacteria bacterium]